MKYSIIVPVYNRPNEVDELLQSLCQQTVKDFEVLIIEDGSIKTCKDVCDKYANILVLHYHAKENSGPGQSRNYGAERAKGEYVIILDSDVVLPNTYIEAIDKSEGNQLFHDILLHNRWHPRWKSQTRQVLSPFVQYGDTSGCLSPIGWIYKDAFW